MYRLPVLRRLFLCVNVCIFEAVLWPAFVVFLYFGLFGMYFNEIWVPWGCLGSLFGAILGALGAILAELGLPAGLVNQEFG